MGIHAPSRLGRQDRQDSQSTQRSSCHQGPLGIKNSRQRASFLRCGRWPREKPEPFSYAAWMSARRGATATFFRGPPFSRTAIHMIDHICISQPNKISDNSSGCYSCYRNLFPPELDKGSMEFLCGNSSVLIMHRVAGTETLWISRSRRN